MEILEFFCQKIEKNLKFCHIWVHNIAEEHQISHIMVLYESRHPELHPNNFRIAKSPDDLKTNFNRSPKMIADDMKDICKLVLNSVYYSACAAQKACSSPVTLSLHRHVHTQQLRRGDFCFSGRDFEYFGPCL